MTSDLEKWLNNPHGVGGDYDKYHGVGEGSDDDEETYDYTFYDSADMTRRTVSRNNDENYDEEDRVASDNEAHQTDEESYNDDDENDEEDNHDDHATHYTDASVRKRVELGFSPYGKPVCFLCAEEHLASQCTTYPDERVRSRQCSCGLYHTEGVCTVWSADSEY